MRKWPLLPAPLLAAPRIDLATDIAQLDTAAWSSRLNLTQVD